MMESYEGKKVSCELFIDGKRLDEVVDASELLLEIHHIKNVRS